MSLLTMDNFKPYIYAGPNIPYMIDSFLKDFSDSEVTEFTDVRKFLMDYRHLVMHEQDVTYNRVLDLLFDYLKVQFPNLKYEISSRRKAFLKYIKKGETYLSIGKQLSDVHDLNGYRIILHSDDNLLCDFVANAIFDFFIKLNGYFIVKAEDLVDTESFNPLLHPEVIVLPNTLIKPEYKIGVKNYNLSPKENGYQSLHLFVQNPYGEIFEIQIRTFEMHKRSCLDHSLYDQKKYGQLFKGYDFRKIQSYGFSASGPKKILWDSQGIIESRSLYYKYNLI